MLLPIPVPPPVHIAVPAVSAPVPFYSQFKDITSPSWQKVGCGVTSLAMVINYYKPHAVTVNSLLTQARAAGAYDTNAGWKHAGLISVAGTYGLTGTSYDLGGSSPSSALATLTARVARGPVIASVHYKFEPKNPIPHMVVIEKIADGLVYYNDPAAVSGHKTISMRAFSAAWKQKFIVLTPAAV